MCSCLNMREDSVPAICAEPPDSSSASARGSSVQDEIGLRQIDGLIVVNRGELTPLERESEVRAVARGGGQPDAWRTTVRPALQNAQQSLADADSSEGQV
jgi:hypothetical protein